MGDLKGHILPGFLFLTFGIWWTICCVRRYLICKKANRAYVSSAAFCLPFRCGRMSSLPVEGFFKIGFSCLGILGEIIGNLPHPSMGIIQHATMYFFYAISGVTDIAVHYGAPLPKGTDYMVIAIAVGIEGMLFANHLHGRPPLDVHLHTLLVYVIFLSAIVIILESKFQKSAILTLCRAYLTILQGSWFCAVGIVLYGHKKGAVWDVNSHEHVMKTTLYFSWHCAGILLGMLCFYGIMSCLCRRIGGSYENGSSNSMSLKSLARDEGKANGRSSEYSILRINDEFEEGEDSDIEFEKPIEKQAPMS